MQRQPDPGEIARLVELRRQHRDAPKIPTGKIAAWELATIRGDFGDWCWLAWYAHRRSEYREAANAIKRALELRPRHHEASQLAAQIDSDWAPARLQERLNADKDKLLREAADEARWYRAAHPVTVPARLTSGLERRFVTRLTVSVPQGSGAPTTSSRRRPCQMLTRGQTATLHART